MSGKRLIILLATPVIVVAAIAISQLRAPQTDREQPLLFPELTGKVNDITEINIRDADATLTIRNKAGQWTIADADGYPALVDKVRETVLGVADMRVIAQKTSDPERYKALGVREPGTRGATSHLLRLDSNGEALVSLIVGKARKSSAPSGASGLYVRVSEQEQALLVTGRLELSADVTEWFKRDIAHVAAERVRAVQLNPGAEDAVRLERAAAEDDLAVQGLADGKQQETDYKSSRMATVFENVYVDGVRKAEGIDFDEPDSTVSVATFDGLLARAQVKKVGEYSYALFSFEADPEQAVAAQAETGAEPVAPDVDAPDAASSDTDEADNQAHDAAAKDAALAVLQEAKQLNELVDGWAYRLSASKSELFNQSLADLTRDPE